MGVRETLHGSSALHVWWPEKLQFITSGERECNGIYVEVIRRRWRRRNERTSERTNKQASRVQVEWSASRKRSSLFKTHAYPFAKCIYVCTLIECDYVSMHVSYRLAFTAIHSSSREVHLHRTTFYELSSFYWNLFCRGDQLSLESDIDMIMARLRLIIKWFVSFILIIKLYAGYIFCMSN